MQWSETETETGLWGQETEILKNVPRDMSRGIHLCCLNYFENLQCFESKFTPITKRSTLEKIAADYNYFGQFPNCLVSIDWKHLISQASKNSGFLYYNYKN